MMNDNSMEIYKNFAVPSASASPDLSSNKAYLASIYSSKNDSFEVQYYNDPKKEKKGKIKSVAVIVAALGLAAAAVGAVASNKNIGKLLKEGNFNEMGEEIKNLPIFKKISAFMANINPVKDDMVERAADKFKEKKIPILRHFEKYCTATKNFYRGILAKFQKANYEANAKILKEAGITVEDFDTWFNKTNSIVMKTLKGTDDAKKFFTKGIFTSPKQFIEKMTGSNIANDILVKNGAFREAASEIVVADANLSKEAQVALENLNKARDTIASKLRDINAGSAATDFMTIGTSVAGLGIATAASETNEERKSIAVNLGIPLITTLTCNSFIGNAKAISGAPALLFSLAAGQIASLGAKFVDKKVLGNKDGQKDNISA